MSFYGSTASTTNAISGRKLLIGGICVVLLVVGVILLTYFLCSGEGEFVLDRTPLFAGRNNLPESLMALWAGNLSLLNLNSDLREIYQNDSCFWCNTDLPRLRRGKVKSQFWIANAGCSNDSQIYSTLKQLDIIDRLIKKYPSDFQLIRQSKDLKEAHKNNKLGSIIAVDGGQSLMDSNAVLRIFYNLGVRAVALGNNCTLESGNTTMIKSLEMEMVVHEMNTLGMMIDIQGLSKITQKNILNISSAPVMISHTAAAALYKYEGNTDDEIMELIKSRDGLLMITFDALNLGKQDNVTVSDVTKHINYVVDKIGFDNIAIGGNYDSYGEKPAGLEDVSDFPLLFKELKAENGSKWTAGNLDKLAGTNFERFFKNVENVRNYTLILENE
ncbi:hypothetical protein WA026_018207 [Henosepilachna vigintioctopunctata]|uniref:Dipeptidase n=1 Tax=Henosepilachna vigintioctopunctata TaxID=420089 RepID=A0AAW1VI58_9CUCU